MEVRDSVQAIADIPTLKYSNEAERLAAMTVLWCVQQYHKDAQVVLIAPSLRELEFGMWTYLRRAHYELGLPGRLTRDCTWLADDGRIIAFGVSGKSPMNLSGIHRNDGVLVVIDTPARVSAHIMACAEALVTGTKDLLLVSKEGL